MSEAPETGAVRNPNRRMFTLGALALVGMLMLVALVAYQMRAEQRRDEAIARQADSYEVLIRTASLSAMLGRAEAALGRYVVSGDRRIGQQYSEEWSKAGDQISRLERLTRHNSAQRQAIAAVRAAYRARGAELSATALYAVHNRNSDAYNNYYAVSESDALAELTLRVERFIDAERTLLIERSSAAAAAIGAANTATRTLAAFGILLVFAAVLLGWFTVEAIGERAEADAEAGAERVRSAELEEAVSEATAQLREEARERAEAEARLRQVQKMEAVGQLTGGIAHDFNNMLAVVLGGRELARRRLQEGGTDAERHIENAMEGANRAAALTRRLLAFSRSEPLLPEAIEPAPLIRGMTDLLDRTLGDTIAVETREECGGWRVWVDRHQLENAGLNLAVNARDAMNGRGTLTIATGRRTLAAGEIGDCAAGDYATIAVRDTGSGMTPDVLERVFEPFFTTKPVGKGTGLGLSQIFGFVRQSEGEIGIETAPGAGTTVTLYLPRYSGPTEEAAPDRAEPRPRAPSAPLDILVVEDDPRVLAATLGALDELGHRAVGCDDPLAAPARIAAMPALDLIVSDVLMPGQTGPEMVTALAPELRGVAILFVTGFAGEAEPDAFGGHPVLRKPFTMATLARAVEEAIAQQRARPAPNVRAP